MPWTNGASYHYNQIAILANAPAQSGVYALYTAARWVYIGESGDIRARLLQHLTGDNPLIIAAMPTSFSFELVPAAQRVARQNILIAELRPACNQRMG